MIHKSVTLRFDRGEVLLGLSHALFSSYDVDVGSRLLLSTLPHQIDLDNVNDALDVGCGVGTLGLAIARRCPHARLRLSDRSAAGVWVAQENARRNTLTNCEFDTALGAHGVPDGSIDLSLSNLPAKAGGPVLAALIADLARTLRPNGTAAIVVVAPIAQAARAWIGECGAMISHREVGANHVVYHFRPGKQPRDHPEAVDSARQTHLHPYLRGRSVFDGPRLRYTIDGVYGLPNFDQLDHRTTLAFELLRGITPAGRILVLSDDIGHLAIGTAQQASARAEIVHVTGDALSAAAYAHNLPAVASSITPTIAHAAASQPQVDWIVLAGAPEPKTPWNQMVCELVEHALAPGGRMLVSTTSTAAARLISLLGRRVSTVDSRKRHGQRVLLLRRRD